ncbi:unnamed protein product [Mytilus edulis]|uniref:Uncharacterized protein n=1 Tax=Mytilus edulis TaxID=6550 RepID=A0A8S3TZJ3_MYTED|nr:unnamed protein product [Mytilus edulis]
MEARSNAHYCRAHIHFQLEKSASVETDTWVDAKDTKGIVCSDIDPVHNIGKSWLDKTCQDHQNREFSWYNLGFDGTEIQVKFASMGGDTIRPGPKCIQKENFMHIFHTFKPNTVFMQIGGNDLTQENYPDKLARDIVSFADYVITVYGVSHVVKRSIIAEMPTQRSRVRRVAPTDLRDVDPVPVIPDIDVTQPRRRKRARADPPQVPADRPIPSVQQRTESIPHIPVTHPSADQIASAMISQLIDSRVQLTVNREPLTTNFLTNYLTDGVTHENNRRDLHNAEPIQMAESQPNSSYVFTCVCIGTTTSNGP